MCDTLSNQKKDGCRKVAPSFKRLYSQLLIDIAAIYDVNSQADLQSLLACAIPHRLANQGGSKAICSLVCKSFYHGPFLQLYRCIPVTTTVKIINRIARNNSESHTSVSFTTIRAHINTVSDWFSDAQKQLDVVLMVSSNKQALKGATA